MEKQLKQGEFFGIIAADFEKLTGSKPVNGTASLVGWDKVAGYEVSAVRNVTGDIRSFKINGWVITWNHSERDECAVLCTAKGAPRLFKTLDAVERLLDDQYIFSFRVFTGA